ncbi:MAG: type III pantothenate kinase [Lentisphaeria bacterium]|nr:type III pantothenate kinase [Lentisphaeria bacterium]
MASQLRILNIGNTHIHSFLSEGRDSYTHECVLDTARCLALKEEWTKEPLAVSSVVPRMTELCRKTGCFIVSPSGKLPFAPSELDFSTVGADRLANAAALLAGSLPALCVDFGTAITLEYVTENRAFSGGAILPGRALMRKALHDHTGLLPELPLYDSIPEIPGLNTVHALRIGMDHTLVAGVRSLVEKFRRLGVRRVVACGGDRHFFLQYMEEMEDGGEYFTVKGIRMLWEYNQQ